MEKNLKNKNKTNFAKLACGIEKLKIMKNWNNYEIQLKNPSLFTKALLKGNVNKF